MSRRSFSNPDEPPNRRAIRKSQVSTPQQWLVELMQQVGYGTIKNLVVANREPLSNPAPRKRRRYKLTGPGRRRLEVPTGDFILKEPVLNLFELMDEIVNGTVMIEVADGLPADVTIE